MKSPPKARTPDELQDLADRITKAMLLNFGDEVRGLEWAFFISELDQKEYMAISSNECIVCLNNVLTQVIEVHGLDHLDELTQDMFVTPKSKVN